MEYPKALGSAIREIRKAKRLTISDVMFETRMCHQAVRKIEQGIVYPKLDTILRICQVLEVKPSVLFTMADNRL